MHRASGRQRNAEILCGFVADRPFPISCADLWRIGHSLSGLYSVMGEKQVDSVYCDFTKLPTDSGTSYLINGLFKICLKNYYQNSLAKGIIKQPNCFAGFQKWIGYVDVKSSPVYFYVHRNAEVFNTIKTPIPFDVERLNVGGAMNLTSGKFTAPRDGIYAFAFTGRAYLPASSSQASLNLYMYLNGNMIGRGWADEVGTVWQFETLSFQTTLNLQKGDEIWLEIHSVSTGAYLNGYSYTQFSGYLLEENIAIV